MPIDDDKITPVRLVIMVLVYLLLLFVLAILVFRAGVFKREGRLPAKPTPTERTAPKKTSLVGPQRELSVPAARAALNPD